MNPVMLRKKFEQQLIRRGMIKTITGDVIIPPKRRFKVLGEEILWMINEAKFKMSVSDLSNYLGHDEKIISKVMRKLTATNVNLVKKEKVKGKYLYSANFQENINIPTIYKLVRMNATKKIR